MMEEDKTIRSFIALELPVKIIDGLKKIQDELKDGTNKVAWAKPENIHLTLKFLGDIEAYKIDSIARLLEGAAAKSCSFDISVKGVGTFPAAGNPRVIWVGIEQSGVGGSELGELYDNLEHKFAAIGFPKEERTFKPHLTLGRIKLLKDKKVFKERLEEFKDREVGQFTVHSLCFFKSRLTPEGAIHTRLKEYTLQTTDKKLRG